MAFIPNPAVPYIGPLHGVSPDLLLNIAGQPTPTAKWFAINLQCGTNMNPRDDIALHINPRFEGNTSKIIRNSLQNQQWGMEENFGHFPLMQGQPFEILILVEQDVFKIAVNGEHYTDFRHRFPLTRINTLTIDGEVQIHSIRFEGGNAGLPPEVQQHVSSGQLSAMPMAGAAGQPHGMPMPTGRSPSPQPHGMPMPTGRSPSPQPHGMPMPTAAGGVPPPQYTGGYGGASHGGGGMPKQQHMPQAAGAAYGYQGQQPYTTQGQGYPAQQPYGAAPYSGGGSHGVSAPVHVPGSHSPNPGGGSKHQYLKYGAVGLGGALAGAALSRLVYPGHKGYKHHGGHHGGYGHHGMGGMMGMGHGMMGGHGHHGNKKMKKMMKHKHGHKFKHKHHKGWKGKSSSSSSSE